MTLGPLARDDQQQAIHCRIVPRLGEADEGVDALIAPHIVGIDAEKGVGLEQRLGAHQAAAGLEQRVALVGNDDGQVTRMFRQMRLDHPGAIMDVDDDPPHPGGAQMIQHMVDQRRAADTNERLGPIIGQRAHARAQPSRHDHRARWQRRHAANDAQKAARLSAGTWASNHARSGARCGAARSRSNRPHIRGWNWR